MLNTSVKSINKIESWLLASRPKTLLAAFVPVIIGSSIAAHHAVYKPFASLIALICAVLIQVGTNFVNDLYDYYSGADTEERKGPQRVLASGLGSVKEMKIAITLTFGLAFFLGLYLVAISDWVVLLIGVLSIITGIAYTAGPYPLAYNGLGDIFVFLFFGIVGTVGTYYVLTLSVKPVAFWASIPVGALITNILVVNNYRDVNEDKISGKNTLAVKFGKKFTRIQYVIFTFISYAILFVVYFTFKQSIIIFLPLLSLPLSIKLVKMIYNLKGKQLNKTLELTAKLSFIYGVLFAFGILL
ncbi:MAG: 1,4-dihydroxy-2-naphthoate polyprenyltransferase [Ignavibacteria bacterium]|jgi:1,4-dihydroxy-2-naphthoate octaprenyltransferase